MSDFSEILYEEAERHADRGYGTKNANMQNPRWRTAAILKIVKSPYLSEKSSNFDEIWYTIANVEADSVHMTKNSIFKNSRWRMTKFGVLQQILNLMRSRKALSQYLRCDRTSKKQQILMKKNLTV